MVVAVALPPIAAAPAMAQTPRQEYRDDVRDARRDLRDYNCNRFEPGQNRDFADRYYQPRALGRNDRIHRGQDNRYYCGRSDGTNGLIVGGIVAACWATRSRTASRACPAR